MRKLGSFWLENGLMKTISRPTFLIHRLIDPLLKRLINQSKIVCIDGWIQNQTERYMDSLESLLEGYNKSYHSSFGLPPKVLGMIIPLTYK